MEGSLRKYDWLNQWPLVIVLNLRPLSCPQREVLVGLKAPTLLSQGWSPGNQSPS